jgi:enterochelin esterase-like enzyme
MKVEITISRKVRTLIMILLVNALCLDKLTGQSLPVVSSGKIVRLESFKSEYVDSRNIDIWLPDNYSENKKYPVIYMHDGQMLFDSTNTWNHQEWQVDEILGDLIAHNEIKECIVVGIWNNVAFRHS